MQPMNIVPQQRCPGSEQQGKSSAAAGGRRCGVQCKSKRFYANRRLAKERTTVVFCHDPDFKSLITAPLSAVHHMPPPNSIHNNCGGGTNSTSRLIQCRHYTPATKTETSSNSTRNGSSCPEGHECKYVHLDVTHPDVRVQVIHVNYAYRSLDDVPHDRLQAPAAAAIAAPERDGQDVNHQERSQRNSNKRSTSSLPLLLSTQTSSTPAGMLSIMAPNNRAPCELVPYELVLDTVGVQKLENSTAPLSHCAHFYFNHCCDRGSRCHFVHTVHIDETAEPGQRAPARCGVDPTPQEQIVQKKQRKDLRESGAAVPQLRQIESDTPPPPYIEAEKHTPTPTPSAPVSFAPRHQPPFRVKYAAGGRVSTAARGGATHGVPPPLMINTSAAATPPAAFGTSYGTTTTTSGGSIGGEEEGFCIGGSNSPTTSVASATQYRRNPYSLIETRTLVSISPSYFPSSGELFDS